MASIKRINERKFKITISNGYRADGRKISKAKTITIPDTVPRKQIEQYVNHVAVELERVFKTGYAEYGEMSFEEYSRHWLSRQLKYSQGTKESYRRILEKVYPYIGDIAIAKLRPLALENMLAELRKMQHHGKPIKESTVQKYLTVVSAVLSDAKRNEIIQKNPARMINLPQCEQSKQFVPTDEEAQLFELSCKQQPQQTASNMTLAEYSKYWFENIAPNKLASSTVAREKSDIDRFLPHIGHYKLTELRPEHFRKLYVALRKEKNMINGKPLSELTVEGVHACLCGILSDAVESGLLDHNPAWRTYKYSNIDKKQQVVADEEILQKLICALEKESIKYETYFKLIIATGIRRGECCGIKWSDIDYAGRSIHICRNVVKVSGEDICIKEPKTKAGNRYVYFSPEMGTLLKEYRRYCETEALHYEDRIITDNDFLFRKHDLDEPMTPTTFTWRFKLILKKNNLPYNLNVHSLRHTNASLLIANGTDVATVSSLLGHAQVSTTLDIYTHAFDKNKKAASDKLHNALEI